MNDHIRELRLRLDITQDELAMRVGVRRETIVFLEKNKYNLSLRLAYYISRVFRTAIEEVFIFEEPETS